MALKGRCLCGGVQYEVDAEPVAVGTCHCTRCQRQSGGTSMIGVVIPQGSLRFVAGEDLVKTFSEETFADRHFCSNCGSAIYGSTENLTFVTAGGLDHDSGIESQFHMMVGFKAPWDHIHDELPQFPEYPPA